MRVDFVGKSEWIDSGCRRCKIAMQVCICIILYVPCLLVKYISFHFISLQRKTNQQGFLK